MQFQAQKLVTRSETSQTRLTQRDVDDLDLFVGVNTAITSPYNLFVRVSDIETNASLIYFYAYSLGREKVMLWGVYDAINNEFLVDNNCTYDINDLASIIKIWQDHAYKFLSSSQKDMMTMNLRQNRIYDDVKYQRSLWSAFRVVFYANLVYDGLLNLQQIKFLVQASDPKIYKNLIMQQEVNRLIEENADVQADYYDQLRAATFSGMTLISRIKAIDDDYSAYMNLLNTMLKYIDADADRSVIRQHLTSASILSRLQSKLADLISTTLYLITFSDFEEYKAAKLLVYLYDESNRLQASNIDKKKQQIPLYLKGTFLYEWLLHIAGIFKVYAIEEFMFDMAAAVVGFTENKINNSSGVIGIRGQLTKISTFFQNFIAKSVYSKSSYTKEFHQCPKIKTCQSKHCDLIYHGVGRHQSRHDLL